MKDVVSNLSLDMHRSSGAAALRRTTSSLRSAISAAVAKLLEPLDQAVNISLQGCLREACRSLFPEAQLNPLALELASVRLASRIANPVRHLIAMKNSPEHKLEGNVLAECFKRSVAEHTPVRQVGQPLRKDDVALVFERAVDDLLDTILERVEKRIKAFLQQIFTSPRGRAAIMQAVVMDFLRTTADLKPDGMEGPAEDETVRALRSANAFLNKWETRAKNILRAQIEKAEDNKKQLSADVITNLARREISLTVRRRAQWRSSSDPHPSRDQLASTARALKLSIKPYTAVINRTSAKQAPHVQQLKLELVQLMRQLTNRQPTATVPPFPALVQRPVQRYPALQHRLNALSTARLQLTIVDVAADGNCLFAAVADQLTRLSQVMRPQPAQVYTADQLRAIAVLGLLNTSVTAEEAARFEELQGRALVPYCEQMMQPGQWGGELELQALADYFRVNIQVHFGHADCSYIVRTRQNRSAITHAPMLHIGFVNGANDESNQAPLNHYVSIAHRRMVRE
jgi:hypothetical protein